VESWLGTGLLRAQGHRERRSVGVIILIPATVSAFALASLFLQGRNSDLLLLGMIAMVAFLVQGLLRKLSRRTRMLSQVVGALGLSVTAPAAYYVATGKLDHNAWTLGIANLLLAGNQIHFVQLRIRSARASGWSQEFATGRGFLVTPMLLVDGSAIRLALRSSTCARGIGIPAASRPRPGLVCRTPDVVRSAQTGLDRTRSFRHLRNRAHRRISPRPVRTVPPPRTTASRRGNSREERVRLRYHLSSNLAGMKMNRS